jgi:hypothetical protein
MMKPSLGHKFLLLLFSVLLEGYRYPCNKSQGYFCGKCKKKSINPPYYIQMRYLLLVKNKIKNTVMPPKSLISPETAICKFELKFFVVLQNIVFMKIFHFDDFQLYIWFGLIFHFCEIGTLTFPETNFLTLKAWQFAHFHDPNVKNATLRIFTELISFLSHR